jgi:hypothetical protein
MIDEIHEQHKEDEPVSDLAFVPICSFLMLCFDPSAGMD